MEQVIYLQAEDDLPAMQNLLEGAQARRVLLVVPKSCTVLRQPLTARMLRRSAANLALEVALVSRDSRTREAARQEGLAVVPSVAVGRWGRWRMGSPRRSAAEQAAMARVAGIRSGRGDPGFGDKAIVWMGRVLGVLLFLFLLAVVVALAALLVPEAQITLVPFRETVDVSLELRADPEVEKASLAVLTIPARLVEAQVEQTGETATMSTKDAPAAPAKGTLTIINQTAAPREILPGAIVRTSTGTTVRFRTVTTATLPANVGATAQVQIEALEPGPVGNVPAATITTVETSELRGKVRVINEGATQGGGVKQVGVVTRADMDRLKAQFLEQLERKALMELQDQLGEQEFLAPDSVTIEIMSEVYDQFLEAEADTLRLTMRIYAVGTAVDQANVRLLAYQALRDKVPVTSDLTDEDMDFALGEEMTMDGRVVLLQAKASAPLVAEVNRREARSLAAGLTVDEAVEALEQSLALGAPPEVRVQPEWIKRLPALPALGRPGDRVPYLPFRIQVVVRSME